MSKYVTRAFFLALITTLFVWLPFFLRIENVLGVPLPQNGMETIASNYDGPLYIVVAKTLYDPIQAKEFPFDIPSEYYAAHFPLYPLLIKLFAVVLGFPYAMLSVTLLSSVLALYYFQKFIADFIDSKHVFWITFVFALFPARWLIVRTVGSPEPLFIAAIIASAYYFRKEKYLWTGEPVPSQFSCALTPLREGHRCTRSPSAAC
jgi:hypothetical protein